MGISELCNLDEGCSSWKFRYFRDCVCSTRDEVSFYLGMASIFCWGIAEVPQIIANWRAGNSEGVSLAFILTWTVGDVFNLVGCLMDPATLPTQFYTAVLYTATTLVLVAQHIWYNWWKEPPVVQPASSHDDKESLRLQGWEPSTLEGLFPSDPTLADGTRIPGVDRPPRNGRAYSTAMASSVPASQQSPNSYTGSWRRLTLASSYGTSPRLRALMVAAIVTGGLRLGSPLLWGARTLPSGTSGGFVMSEGGRKLLQTSSDPSILQWGGYGLNQIGGLMEDDTELRDIVGQILGWAMTAIYLTGRLPQIILNITRGTVEGLSWSMFAFAIGGNATYLGSILVRSLEWRRLKPNLPWLVDSACCLAMDFFILGQCAYYTVKAYQQKQRAGYLDLNGH